LFHIISSNQRVDKPISYCLIKQSFYYPNQVFGLLRKFIPENILEQTLNKKGFIQVYPKIFSRLKLYQHQ